MNEEMQHALTEAELRLKRTQANKDRADKELAAVRIKEAKLSRRELQTLVEARMEVVLLLDEKKSLQSNQDHGVLNAMRAVREKERTQRQLQQRLEDLVDGIESTKNEIRLLQRFCRRQEAKIIPLREHKSMLQQRRLDYSNSGTSERTLLRSAFDRYDRDCSQKLTVDEIVLVLQDLNMGGGHITQGEINQYLKRHDGDGDGMVDFDEFCSVFDRLCTE